MALQNQHGLDGGSCNPLFGYPMLVQLHFCADTLYTHIKRSTGKIPGEELSPQTAQLESSHGNSISQLVNLNRSRVLHVSPS